MSENAWIEWSGGECPVAGDTEVDVWLKDGRTWTNLKAEMIRPWRWDHSVQHLLRGFIRAYRLSGPSA